MPLAEPIPVLAAEDSLAHLLEEASRAKREADEASRRFNELREKASKVFEERGLKVARSGDVIVTRIPEKRERVFDEGLAILALRPLGIQDLTPFKKKRVTIVEEVDEVAFQEVVRARGGDPSAAYEDRVLKKSFVQVRFVEESP